MDVQSAAVKSSNSIILRALDKIKADHVLFATSSMGVVAIMVFAMILKPFDVQTAAIIALMVILSITILSVLLYKMSGASIQAVLQSHQSSVETLIGRHLGQVTDTVAAINESADKHIDALKQLTLSMERTLALAAISERGTIELRGRDHFMEIWSKLILNAKSSFIAVNYICLEELSHPEYDVGRKILAAQTTYQKVEAERIFFVDDDEEAAKVAAMSSNYRADRIRASCVKVQKLVDKGVFQGCGFSADWNCGFILLDDAVLAIFYLENRVPRAVQISVDYDTIHKYKRLVDEARRYAVML